MLLLLPFVFQPALALPPSGKDADLGFEEVVLGESHACGRTPTGLVACWGRNDRGQLGDGTFDPSRYPRVVDGLMDVVALSAGTVHTCAIKRDRSVVCWGDNQSGQLGAGTMDAYPAAVEVQGLGPVLTVSAGDTHTCAVTTSQQVSCWGNNLYGQLGTPSLRAVPRPVPVPSLSGATDVAAGYGHTCAVGPELPVTCWGDSSHGELGRTPDEKGRPLLPAPVDPPIPGARAVEARGTQSCALTDGGVVCWGQAPLDEVPKPVPELVLPRHHLVQLSLGWGHACALTGGREAVCFGDDRLGALGGLAPRDGAVLGAYGLRGVTTVAAGAGESCAARGADGRTVCWGAYSNDEKAAAKLETLELTKPKTKERRLALQQGTEFEVSATEVLGFDGAIVRIEIATVDTEPCANTKIDTEIEWKKKRVILLLGDTMLPGGDCIATTGPAVTHVDFPRETLGRRFVALRHKRREDFYEVVVKLNVIEIIPLQETFSEWTGPKVMQRIPPGSLAISCIDHLESPMCQRRMRDGLPMCKDLEEHERLNQVPTLEAGNKPFASDWFAADPEAVLISPDTGHAAYKNWFADTWRDGSGCLDIDVKTWRGEVWTNQHPDTAP